MAKAKANISNITGLTPTQEKACSLLASGEAIEVVAEEVKVPESTLLLWQKQTTFKCYFNQKRSNVKGHLTQGVYSLAQEAVNALRESLNSENEQVRLKAATYRSGMFDTEARFHESEYKTRLQELGVKEQDYQSTL